MKPKTLAFIIALGAGMIAVTFVVTRAFYSEQTRLARHWVERGKAALAESQPAAAVTAFRTALLYDRDNEDYQFKLAKALAASGRTDEAEAYFTILWEREPGNAEINLELARVAEQRQDYADGVRFFHGAIYGVWPDKPAQHRSEARLELVHLLLGHRAAAQADAELIALEPELAETAGAHKQVADLFMQVQDYPRALDEYRRAATLDRAADAAPLAGAGQAAFKLGRYTLAHQLLRRAVARGAKDPLVVNTAETLDAMSALDPYAPRLTNQERRMRVVRAFEQAGTRVEQCAAGMGQTLGIGQPPPAANFALSNGSSPAAPTTSPTAVQEQYVQWQQLRPNLTERALRRDPDLLDRAMDLVFRIEREAGTKCGTPTAADSALVLIARQREGS